jgi:hypothetical protein
MNRPRLPILLLILAGLGLLAFYAGHEWRLTGGLGGVPLDDSWIHYRFADNLRSGSGFSFNPGQPTPGSTSPLWVVLLSPFGPAYLPASKLIGGAAYLGLGILTYLLGRRLGLETFWAFLAGLGALGAGRLGWLALSGMETSLFTLVWLAGMLLWLADGPAAPRLRTSLLFGAACLLRPEGYLLALLSAAAALIWQAGEPDWRKRTVRSVRHLAVAAAIAAPYLAFSYLTTGRLLTSTFYVKTSTWGCEPGLEYFLWISAVFLLDHWFLALLGLAGSWLAFRSAGQQPALALIAAWWLSLPILYGFIAPCLSSYYLRYTAPVIPGMLIVGGLAGDWLEKRLSGGARPHQKAARLFRFGIGVGSLLALLPALIFWGPYYGQSVADIEAMQVATGRWLAANTKPGELLAVNDVGAIGYLSGREVLDLGGLISPQVVPVILGKKPGEWDAALGAYLAQVRPEYLVIFPNWYPRLAETAPCQAVHRVQLAPRAIAGIANLTVAGGGNMIVYRCAWP